MYVNRTPSAGKVLTRMVYIHMQADQGGREKIVKIVKIVKIPVVNHIAHRFHSFVIREMERRSIYKERRPNINDPDSVLCLKGTNAQQKILILD